MPRPIPWLPALLAICLAFTAVAPASPLRAQAGPPASASAPDPPGPVQMPAVSSTLVDAAAQADFATNLVDLVNRKRAEAGCGPVVMDPMLTQAATAHSRNMAERDFFDHIDPQSQDTGDRLSAVGYAWQSCGETLAAGFPDPQQVVDAWMESDGHRRALLNCAACETGVGYYYRAGSSFGSYWTQVFATPADRNCGTAEITVDPTAPQPTLPGPADHTLYLPSIVRLR